MVPASTLMYGSIFWSVTRKPRASRSEPMDAEASPLPSDDTTPPVTKMYFVGTSPLLLGPEPMSNILDFGLAIVGLAVEPAVPEALEHFGDRGTAVDAELDHLLTAQDGSDAPRRVDPPRHRRAGRRSVAEPECGEVEVRALAQEPGPTSARRRRGEPRRQVIGALQTARGARERLTGEPEAAQDRRRDVERLVGEQRDQRDLESCDVEPALARPRCHPRQRAHTLASRAREAIARVEQAKDASHAEPAQGHVGTHVVEYALELGCDALAGDRGIGAQAQRQRLTRRRPRVVDEIQPGGIARAPEDTRRVVHERQRMQDA